MHEDFYKALSKAKMDMLRKPKAVFISTISLMVKQVVDLTCPTAATDGTTNYYNPEFFLSLPREQRVTLLAHEAMHPALMHLDPCYEHLDRERLNKAGDYVINQFLVDAGFTPIPKWLFDPKYKGMTTMQVYKLLQDEESEEAAGGGGGDPGQELGDWADLRPLPKDMSPSEKAAQNEAVRTMVASAAQAVSMAAADGRDPGSIPADVQVFLDGLLKPKLPMSTHLRRFFREVDKSDYSWKRPNRRFTHVVMPSLYGHKLAHIAFAFDMSGSVSDLDTKRYMTEVHEVMKRLKPDKITIVLFDTEIKSTWTVKSLQDLANIELRGRGGTYIEPLMVWARENKPTALCVFTDGEYGHPSFNPKCPVMWMIHGYNKEQFHCDFGTTILFESADD